MTFACWIGDLEEKIFSKSLFLCIDIKKGKGLRKGGYDPWNGFHLLKIPVLSISGGIIPPATALEKNFMKKILLICIAIMILAVPQVFAGKSSGCGLGQSVFEGQSGLFPNVLAATTNGTSGNQTFGMTSGTSNCDQNDTVQNEKMQEHFVATNFENISDDMARGEGQYIAAMADLMGCSSAVQVDFARVSQEKYEVLFGASSVDAKTWLGGFKSEMAKNPALAAGCGRIS